MYCHLAIPHFTASDVFLEIISQTYLPRHFRFTSPPATTGGNFSYFAACADAPSFSDFAFNRRASAEPGSFNKRTKRVAEDERSPSNCASKTSRGGKSASVSNSAVERTVRSTIQSLRAGTLNSAADILK